jgi:hypothetical protein
MDFVVIGEIGPDDVLSGRGGAFRGLTDSLFSRVVTFLLLLQVTHSLFSLCRCSARRVTI